MLGGIGQGISQKQSMQEQIAAMQWADRSFSDPKQAAQLTSAAAQPITVPQGYLQRAQALRSMTPSSSPQPAAAPTTRLPGT
jgi:hypothetical protein